MKLNNNILIFSHKQFDTICKSQCWNDENVNNLDNIAFISIIGTKECREYWMDEDNEHWFKNNHLNVLNLDFDDLFSDIEYDGHSFKAMTIEQAIESINFIENNLGKTFMIHCHAGISRSQAYFRFITSHYSDLYKSDCGRKENACNSPNIAIIGLLNEAYKIKHNIIGSIFGNIE